MKGFILAVFAVACVYNVSAGLANSVSTAKIIGKLCYVGDNKSNQTLVDGFFGCYDEAPGKPQFVQCQVHAFGAPMDTVEAVKKTCKNPLKIPTYAKCLKTEFARAGIEMDPVVEIINACQSEVMGIKSKA